MEPRDAGPDGASTVRVLLAGRTLVTFGQALVVVASLGLLWLYRAGRLRDGLRALRARGREVAAPA